jgi:hypothetical protein
MFSVTNLNRLYVRNFIFNKKLTNLKFIYFNFSA